MAKQKKLRKEPTNVVGSIVILIGSLIMIFPFIWMILSSFKTVADVYSYPPKWLPSEWNLNNFKKVFEMIPFWTYYGNSIFTSVVQTFLQIAISVLAAYALTKLRFPGRSAIFKLIVTSLMFHSTVNQVTHFIILSSFGWIDTYLSIIVPSMAGTMGLYLMKQFTRELSSMQKITKIRRSDLRIKRSPED